MYIFVWFWVMVVHAVFVWSIFVWFYCSSVVLVVVDGGDRDDDDDVVGMMDDEYVLFGVCFFGHFEVKDDF